jgi:glycosyltransferase involved in cell wall biosynthesis
MAAAPTPARRANMAAVTSVSSDRLRVVQLTHVARLSGAEIGLVRFAQAAPQLDITAILAEDGPLVDALRDAGVRVEVLPLAADARDARRAEIASGAVRAAAAAQVGTYVYRLAGRLHRLQPDLVHTISLKAGVYGSLAARVAARPVLWHLHDYLSGDYLAPRVAAVMRQVVTRLPDALATPSRSCLEAVGPGARRLPTSVFPFPVPMPGEAAEIRPAVRTVGIVGRITPWKGQDVFLRGFAQAFPDDGVRARIIGSALFGEEDFERELRDLAAQLGIAERVEFRGFRSDVVAELRELDVLVHASVLPDPLPGVVLEGLGAGLPIVASSAGGHAELLTAADAGLLFAPRDDAALAGALRRLAGDGELRRALATRGRAKAREFAPDAVVHQIVDFYEQVVSLARRPRRTPR